MTRRIVFATAFLPVLMSCQPIGYIGEFKAGTCISERNKRYIASAKGALKVYKVHKAFVDKFKISVWNNRSWFYKGEKKLSYFSENKVFAYERVVCPDGSGPKAGITSRLKEIDI